MASSFSERSREIGRSDRGSAVGRPPVISVMATSRGSEYGTPAMIMPWCRSVLWKLVIVISCAPCWLALLVNTLPTLPTSAPPSERDS
jgi:hypothetical protein